MLERPLSWDAMLAFGDHIEQLSIVLSDYGCSQNCHGDAHGHLVSFFEIAAVDATATLVPLLYASAPEDDFS
jgi:hypothetical protein